MSSQQPTDWTTLAAAAAGAVVMGLGAVARWALHARLPKRTPPPTPPDPVSSFNQLSGIQQQVIAELVGENRKLRQDLDAQDSRHQAEMAALRAEMDAQDRQCEARLTALGEQIRSLTLLLAHHGITGEAGGL